MGRIGWSALAAVIALTIGCGPKPPDPKDYVARLAADRAAKDAQFMEEGDPVPKNRQAELLPLAYFAIDPEYNVPAGLKVSAEEKIVEMPTSTGDIRRQRIVGTLEF